MQEMYDKVINSYPVGYQIDSRLIKKDMIFFAIKGEKVDGHDFLDEVFEKGAKFAIVDKTFNNIDDDRLIRVDDVLVFLQGLATYAIKKFKGKIIGVTGSYGKTSVKEYLSAILSCRFKVSKSEKNYNSQRGLPIAILNMDKNVDFLILEMGMDKKGEIENLVKIAPPNIALVTKIALFQEEFKSLDEVSQAKAEIFSSSKLEMGLINHELLEFDVFKNRGFFSFSIKDKNGFYYLDAQEGFFYENSNKTKIKLPFFETHLLENLLAALAVGRYLGIEIKDMEKKFSFLKNEKLRFEKVYLNDCLFIKDCYNANPQTMIDALENLGSVEGEKIAILGSMSHIKIDKEKQHKRVIEVAKKRVDRIFLIGKEWEKSDGVIIFEDLKSLACNLEKYIKKNNLIFIKGPRAFEMEKIFDFLNCE